jgi:hypothetical protein
MLVRNVDIHLQVHASLLHKPNTDILLVICIYSFLLYNLGFICNVYAGVWPQFDPRFCQVNGPSDSTDRDKLVCPP